jgi:hypothetical protein
VIKATPKSSHLLKSVYQFSIAAVYQFTSAADMEFNADSTAVGMMPFMICVAYGMFIVCSALTNGVVISDEFQGTMQTIMNNDAT